MFSTFLYNICMGTNMYIVLHINFVFSLMWFHSLAHSSVQVSTPDVSLLYKPPDLNRNITEVFGKLIDIYRGGTWQTYLFS